MQTTGRGDSARSSVFLLFRTALPTYPPVARLLRRLSPALTSLRLRHRWCCGLTSRHVVQLGPRLLSCDEDQCLVIRGRWLVAEIAKELDVAKTNVLQYE